MLSEVMFSKIKTAFGRLSSRFAPKGGGARAAMMLGGATMITQVAGVLLAPVYSRLYTPADYGVLSVYISIVSFALTVGALCYETGIPVGKNNREAIGLTTISIFLVIVVGLGTMAWFGLESLLGVQGPGSQLGLYLWLVPVGIIGGGLYKSIRFFALRCKAMGMIARTSISQYVGSTVIMLAFGLFWPTPLGLMLASIVGISAGIWGLARRTELIPQIRQEYETGQICRELWQLAKKYKRLPFICTPSTLLNSLGLYLPGIMLAPYYGVDFAGQFFMAVKVIGMPVSFIGGSISQVFFSGAAAVARERPQELAGYFNRVFVRGAACSVLILAVGLAAPWVIPIALGEKWRQAGAIALWIALYNVFGLSVSAISAIPNVVGHFRGQFVIDTARALAVFLVLFLGHRAGLAGMVVIRGFILVMIANYVACYFLYRHQVKVFSDIHQADAHMAGLGRF